MAVTVGAMTGRLSAAAVGKCERAWERIVRDPKTGQQKTRAAAEPGGIRSAGSRDVSGVGHLLVTIPADYLKNKISMKWFLT
jgi:hypothetical protein